MTTSSEQIKNDLNYRLSDILSRYENGEAICLN